MPRPCSRCQKSHVGSFDLCERCRTELTEDYLAGPPAIPEMLAVVAAARATLVTSPVHVMDVHRELAAALRAFDRARHEEGSADDDTQAETPNARRTSRPSPSHR